MNQISLYTLRDIQTQEDLCQVARIHKKAFPDSLLSKLGEEIIRSYYEIQMASPNECYAVGVYHEGILQGYSFGGNFRDIKSIFIKKNLIKLGWQFLTNPSLLKNVQIRHRISTIVKYIMKQPKRKKSVSNSINQKRRPFGILSIAVDPSLQHSGYGKILMNMCERDAIKKQFTSMRLTVNPNNQKAIAFYKGLGWQEILDSEGLWKGHMEKKLTSSELPLTSSQDGVI